MTIDKARLKALAEAVIKEINEYGERWPQEDDWFEPDLCSPELAYVKAVPPETTLSLLAEIEKLTAENARLREDRDGLLEGGAHLI